MEDANVILLVLIASNPSPLAYFFLTRDTSEETGDPARLRWLGDGDNEIEIVYDEEKIFCTGPTVLAYRLSLRRYTICDKTIQRPYTVPFVHKHISFLFTPPPPPPPPRTERKRIKK